ncbi:MAG: DNA repair protein RadC [Oscillospiraceae bacterium]|nr:DNA repair protein RadC [Oscillospiraceae bacterium]
MSIHDGHRQRLKDRFLREGLDGFTEIQALELLLFYAIPVKDTNELAHRLLDRFGNLSRVLDAPVEKLMEVEGIKEHAATLLKLAKAMGRCYDISRSKIETVVHTVADCGNYLLPFFRDRRNETVFLMSLDAKLKVLDCQEIGEGSVNYASVPVRRVVETALAVGASSVVLAHNHPSGIAVPSTEDIQTTRRVAAALSAVEIELADHIVFADGDYVSMVQSGYRFDNCLAI